MATPLSADDIVRALRNEGVKVVEHRSWRTHNRNHKGPWGPVHGVMIHHTVSEGTSNSVELCYNGHSTLPGPLCHGVIAKDGTVFLVGNGRTNHAGLGDDDVLDAVIDERALPKDDEANTDGNRRFYGFECINLGDGEDPWPESQLNAIVRASAALCRVHGWDDGSVIGHLEWQPGKVDPRGPRGSKDGPDLTMSWLRGEIHKRLAKEPDSTNAPRPTPTPTKPKPVMPKFPGRQYFILGAVNPHAKQLQTWLHQGNWGPRYRVGPSSRMTQMDLEKVKALQKHYLSALGPADGLTGPKTWQYAWEVANGLRRK